MLITYACSANALRKNALAFTTLWTNKYVFASGILARLCLMAFKFAVPFLIKKTTGFSQDKSQPDAVGWGLTGAWFLVLAGRAVGAGIIPHCSVSF